MRTPLLLLGFLLLASVWPLSLRADEEVRGEEEEEEAGVLTKGTFGGLKLRSIGPALMSGRIGDFAVDPRNPSRYFVAVASGGVWRTMNGGTTYEPVFDGEGSYSIGCVTLDPNNPNVVWVGTGENNSQRSVGFGDGVYRSRDGGDSWKNVGLKTSEHIGMITVDPRDSNVVYVASQGPLWKAGGERGLYKTTDGGETWERILYVGKDTGINEVHLDPRDPDVLYASSYQRRRRVWTLIDGGPESTIYKSEDAGKTWRKIEKGLPNVDLGRIGLAVSPVDPDVVYAIVEAAQGKSGFYRSTDRGESWKKRGDYKPTGAQYYNEILCDPVDVDRVYALHTILRVTDDGGKTFRRMPRKNRHVDDHALWIDPRDNDHLLVGCDGGIYETWDLGESWHYKPNLPVTQFYRVSVDEARPFYNVYGGTQDNASEGGPSRTTDRAGITNADWFVTVGGDGYETRVDPTDENIVYSLWQYGGLVRHDRRSGEVVTIRPHAADGEPPLRWNWDSPLILSPHDPRCLYFAANKLFCTRDGGDSWEAVSGDLTRKLDRNQLEVMGRIQGVDAVAKDDSTSFYGTIVSLDESPLVKGLLYVGTDDGLVQVSEDGGGTWRKIDSFEGVPEMTYVSCLTASPTEADTVYAAFDNHKNGDFTPYLLVSKDRGKTWTSIAGDLPGRDVCLAIQQDHVRFDLLFVGTEFGAYFSLDRGTRWIRLSGVPTIAVRDLAIQRRENDLVLGTFGRGFYVLDDYSPLRHVTRGRLDEDALLFPVKDALLYVERSRLGGRDGKGSQGAGYYAAPNPPFGAVFTYYLEEDLRTLREARRKRDRKARKKDEPVPYPTVEELRAEDEEPEPQVLLVVRDDTGAVVQRVAGKRKKGIHRAAWNLRYPSAQPVEGDRPKGPLALAGTYTVELVKVVNGVESRLAGPEPFDVLPLELATFAAKDPADVLAFSRRAAKLQRAVTGTVRVVGEIQTRIDALRKTLLDTPAADLALRERLEGLQARLTTLSTALNGDATLRKHDVPRTRSVRQRIDGVVDNLLGATSPPLKTDRAVLEETETMFTAVHADVKRLLERDLKALEEEMEEAGAPWTPGRLPAWTPP